jgi:hypothetical protein
MSTSKPARTSRIYVKFKLRIRRHHTLWNHCQEMVNRYPQITFVITNFSLRKTSLMELRCIEAIGTGDKNKSIFRFSLTMRMIEGTKVTIFLTKL